MKDIHHSCQGESHIVANKVCQDASFSMTNEKISIVNSCDGNDGSYYFRSDVETKMALKSNLFPFAIFLGADGIDGSFGKTENMVNFYIQILKIAVVKGMDKAQKTTIETLPQLCKIGNRDDISLVFVYNEGQLHARIKELIVWQRKDFAEQLFEINNRILKLRERIVKRESAGLNNQKTMTEYRYATKACLMHLNKKRSLVEKWNKFFSELCDVDFT